ncbi:MAG: c-type cytochrome [Paracoccaceae bacterium]
MKTLVTLTFASFLTLTTPVLAAGDIAAGEKAFKKCKACHTITNGDEVIFKGGKTGPNLYGIVGRAAGSEDFKYSKSMLAAGETGLIWDEEAIASYIADPSAYLKEITGDSKAKSKMTFKAKKNTEDLAAYLASVSPEMAETGGETTDSTETTDENNDS